MINETAMPIRRFRVTMTFSSGYINEPHVDYVDIDMQRVVMKVPVPSLNYNATGERISVMTEYKLWELLNGKVLRENDEISANQYDLIDSWIRQEIVSKHPLQTRVIGVDWKYVDYMPIPKEKKLSNLIDDLL